MSPCRPSNGRFWFMFHVKMWNDGGSDSITDYPTTDWLLISTRDEHVKTCACNLWCNTCSSVQGVVHWMMKYADTRFFQILFLFCGALLGGQNPSHDATTFWPVWAALTGLAHTSRRNAQKRCLQASRPSCVATFRLFSEFSRERPFWLL